MVRFIKRKNKIKNKINNTIRQTIFFNYTNKYCYYYIQKRKNNNTLKKYYYINLVDRFYSFANLYNNFNSNVQNNNINKIKLKLFKTFKIKYIKKKLNKLLFFKIKNYIFDLSKINFSIFFIFLFFSYTNLRIKVIFDLIFNNFYNIIFHNFTKIIYKVKNIVLLLIYYIIYIKRSEKIYNSIILNKLKLVNKNSKFKILKFLNKFYAYLFIDFEKLLIYNVVPSFFFNRFFFIRNFTFLNKKMSFYNYLNNPNSFLYNVDNISSILPNYNDNYFIMYKYKNIGKNLINNFVVFNKNLLKFQLYVVNINKIKFDKGFKSFFFKIDYNGKLLTLPLLILLNNQYLYKYYFLVSQTEFYKLELLKEIEKIKKTLKSINIKKAVPYFNEEENQQQQQLIQQNTMLKKKEENDFSNKSMFITKDINENILKVFVENIKNNHKKYLKMKYQNKIYRNIQYYNIVSFYKMFYKRKLIVNFYELVHPLVPKNNTKIMLNKFFYVKTFKKENNIIKIDIKNCNIFTFYAIIYTIYYLKKRILTKILNNIK